MTEEQVLQKTRPVKEILFDSLNFMTGNARNLVLATFTIAMPLILVAITISFALVSSPSAPDIYDVITLKASLDKNLYLLLLFAYVFNIAGMCLFNLGVNKVLLHKKDTEKPVDTFFKRYKNELFEDLKNFAFSFLIVFVLYSVTTKTINYLSMQFTAESTLESYLMLLPVFFLMSACFYLSFAVLFVCYRDQIGVVEAARKVWHYTSAQPKKAWGTAFLLILIVIIAHKCLQFVFFQVISLIFMQDLSAGFLLLPGLLQTCAISLVVMFFQIALVFLYCSLEDEMDGLYIKSKIENI
ncbi:MAG TPA: hypothetical protein PL029_02670 [Bacteroidia bacterium]|nr:hypothetical protein [Bacteroidia bacterium]